MLQRHVGIDHYPQFTIARWLVVAANGTGNEGFKKIFRFRTRRVFPHAESEKKEGK